MENTTLLNIKSTASHSTDIVTGQALAMVSSDKAKTDGFKSAFRNQVENNKKDIHQNKDLPHNGKELPKKKVAAEKQDNTEKSEQSSAQDKSSEAETSKGENNIRNMDDNSANENKSLDHSENVDKTKQANTAEQENNTEQKSSSESDQLPGQDEYSEKTLNGTADSQKLEQAISQTEIQQDEIEQTTVEQTKVDQESASELNDKLNNSEQTVQELLNTEHANSKMSHTVISPDNLQSDKKLSTESTKAQLNLSASASSGNSISQAASVSMSNAGSGPDSGFNSKNETALTKSIAEFQQFIEMSKKHSSAGDSIASVKSFEQSMKVQQMNNQLLPNDIKLPVTQTSGQNALPTQAAMQAIPLDKFNSSLANNPLSFLKTTTPALEVKTAVGKPGWNQNFSNQVIMMANNGVQQAKIRLNPMNLGPVEAMVKLSGETAVVSLTSLHLTTKDALESAIPRLKEMLNENGFSQVDVNVSHQDKKQQQEAALDSKTGSNDEHGKSTMPGDEQLSEETLESEDGMQVSELDDQGLKIVDYYA
ncbi:MAG: flagellar hook-length control protein FliK [Gammaproteobacteria bacterium]|nr:flagellar hook-length control protein FliK [Gammaproteobacteria bacterium]